MYSLNARICLRNSRKRMPGFNLYLQTSMNDVTYGNRVCFFVLFGSSWTSNKDNAKLTGNNQISKNKDTVKEK